MLHLVCSVPHLFCRHGLQGMYREMGLWSRGLMSVRDGSEEQLRDSTWVRDLLNLSSTMLTSSFLHPTL